MIKYSLSLLLLLVFFDCQAASAIQTEDAKQCQFYFDEAEYKKALSYCKKAAEMNDSHSQTYLGEMLDRGTVGFIDRKQADHWWTQAANKNHLEAENLLALKYYHGGTLFEKQEYWKQDYTKAMQIWMKGAKRGVPQSQFMIGVMHQLGQGTEANLIEAYAWFSLAINAKYKLAEDSIYEISRKMSLSDQKQGHEKYLSYLKEL